MLPRMEVRHLAVEYKLKFKAALQEQERKSTNGRCQTLTLPAQNVSNRTCGNQSRGCKPQQQKKIRLDTQEKPVTARVRPPTCPERSLLLSRQDGPILAELSQESQDLARQQ